MSSNEQIPVGDAGDNDYASRTGQSTIPVQRDEAPVDEPYGSGNADSDEQLERDEKDAIESSNIVDSRTRGATKQAGTYAEPSDDEGLPGPEDGTSSGRQ
ncbi:hypothetical protein PMIN06_003872 [Paraphaeosphaeria minitans]|uniref:Histone chaperone domain-containing protein n=1 Tax=Paraphaeosphaeria minitans TaxID=565426 RepID=A0A9P6KV66_9PLEO|nr:hypothetical protein PMIN01_02685 [Paraphaeosphaeria minitans]